MQRPRSVAVIGAGIAGLAAAGRLQKAGCQVVVLEKSRGVGGRMATRRDESLAFDHGAQYFTAHGPVFAAQAEAWEGAGLVAHWPPQGLSGRAEGCWVGVPGMTAPCRSLAEGLLIVTGCTVRDLSRDDDRWRLASDDGAVVAAGLDRFDAVVLAIPAPQAVPLIAASGAALPGPERASYAPCWALMLAGEKDFADLPAAFSPEDGAIAWVARNGTKPGRPQGVETVVVHATPDWSRAHLEMAPETVASQLTQRLGACTRRSLEPTYARAHRWRYALVEQAVGQPCLWNAEAGLGACGDWCIGARVEAAFDSGVALAAAILGEQAPPMGHEARR
ncbi:MAG: FAD-dependent oxidoreductase [Alsobacter sp.]